MEKLRLAFCLVKAGSNQKGVHHSVTRPKLPLIGAGGVAKTISEFNWRDRKYSRMLSVIGVKMSRVMLSCRLRKHANNDSVKSGKLRHPLEIVPQNSLLGKGSRIERSRRRCLFQKPLQFFTSRMSEGGVRSAATGQQVRSQKQVKPRNSARK